MKPNLKSSEGVSACEYLVDNIITRLSKYEERSLPRVATLIDPRFKKQGFRSPFNAGYAEKLLKNELADIKTTPDSVLHAAEPPPAPQKKQSLFQFVQQNIEELPKTRRADAILDLRQYLCIKHSDENTNALEYWKVTVPICTYY